VPKAIAEEVLFLVECLRIAKTLDLLVICGGGQLLDSWGGPWRFPYALFKWIALAKISRGKCYFVNVGAGPLGHPLSKWFVKHALSLADYASFRDAESKALVQTMGFSGGAEVLADNAYGLEALAARGGPTRPAETSSVGISPMAYCHPRRYWDEDQAAYDSLIGKLALFSARLVRSDHRIILFTTDIWFDSVAIDDLTRALTNGANGVLRERIMRPPISEIEDLISHMSQMDYVVTCRYHGVVLAHLMNIPVLALSHHPKIATLMKDLGLSEYCLDIRRFDADLLMERFRRLEDRRDDVKARMARTAADYKRRLTAQFDALFPESMRCGNDSLQRTPGKRTDSRL
jgi:polysaccharide pyruvyl transferase WcaK-like protein